MIGNIHSIETLGLHDGPGIRTIFFFQGCSLRCKYCHNPDSWARQDNNLYAVEELIRIAKRYKNYYQVSGGGVTISGGEALLQPKFLLALVKGLKAEGIHVTLDTSGIGCGAGLYWEILAHIDLVLLDIKSPTKKGFYKMTGQTNDKLKDFIAAINDTSVPVWARQVVIPELNDTKRDLIRLKRYIQKELLTVEKIELLPFHKMCDEKYEALSITFPFAEKKEMSIKTVQKLQRYIQQV